MPRLTDTEGLTDLQRDILRTVRDFTEAGPRHRVSYPSVTGAS